MSTHQKSSFIVLVCIVAALGGLLFGFDTAIISGTIPYIRSYFGLDEFGLGWAVGCILLGCAIGALAAGKVADRYGRRYVLFACAILFALSGIGVALSHHLYLFIFFRLAGGVGVGAAAMVSPMYIAETAPAGWRGRLVALYQLAIVTGILLAYFSNYILADTGSNNWRWMFGSQVLPSVLFLVLLFFVPETPRWLIRQQRLSEAMKVLHKTLGSLLAESEAREIQKSFAEQKSPALSILFRRPYLPVLIIGISIAVFQQVTGINAILYYAPVIFSQTGVGAAGSLGQTIAIGVVNVLSTFIAIVLVDRTGRRRLLLAGSALMFLSLSVVALCFSYRYFQHYIVLVFTLLYTGAFGCTLGAVTWVYLSEIFPNRIRSLALSIATLALWLADFIVTWSFPVLSSKAGTSFTLLIYALFCALAFTYVYIRVPETKGRSLEEIETLFIH